MIYKKITRTPDGRMGAIVDACTQCDPPPKSERAAPREPEIPAPDESAIRAQLEALLPAAVRVWDAVTAQHAVAGHSVRLGIEPTDYVARADVDYFLIMLRALAGRDGATLVIERPAPVESSRRPHGRAWLPEASWAGWEE